MYHNELCVSDSEKTCRFSWAVVVSGLTVVMIFNGVIVKDAEGSAIIGTNKTMVVNQTVLSGPCINNVGAVVGHLAEWRTGCSRVVCHVEVSANFTVTHGCPGYEPFQNPDSRNCQYIHLETLPYPECCPALKCGAAAPLTPLAPSGCADLQSQHVCQIWASLTNNCTDTSAFAYQFAIAFCKTTCNKCNV